MPTKKHWPQWQPWRKKLNDSASPLPGTNQRLGHIPGVETTQHTNLGGQKGGTIRISLKAAQPPILSITLLGGIQSPAERSQLLKTLIWQSCQNWSQESPLYCRGSVENLEEQEEVPPPEPPVGELWEWVTWKAETT